MVPIILISNSVKKTNSFVKDFIKKNKISDNYVFSIRPRTKEFLIEQIRELKKEIIYNFSDPHLYLLYDFDTASFEAQNAFLKTLEEHQQQIRFIMIVRNVHQLTDTILSRSKILNLTKNDVSLPNEGLEAVLERFLTSFDLKIITDAKLQTKEVDNPSELFKNIVFFFRQRLAFDPKSTKAIRKILSINYLVENNHVNPQSGIDHVFLYIRRLYRAD